MYVLIDHRSAGQNYLFRCDLESMFFLGQSFTLVNPDIAAKKAQVNEKLRKHVVATLESKGHPAVAPSLTPQFSVRISPKYGFASTWSERHSTYASGLGTFGLCDGLITQSARQCVQDQSLQESKSLPLQGPINITTSTASFLQRAPAMHVFHNAQWGLS